LPWQGLCQLYPTEKSSISAHPEGEDCAFLRRCGMSLCNAKFFGGVGSKDGRIRAPLDAMRAPQQVCEEEEFERQAPALAVDYLLTAKLPNRLLTQLYCIA
jgi:hypothetical protein